MDYARLKTTADRLILNAVQGTTETGTSTSTPGATPLDPPTIGTTWLSFVGAAFRGVSQQYLNDTTLLATDLQGVIQADTDVEVGQQVRLDGIVHTIVRVDKIPAVGITVAKRIFVRA